MTIRVMHVGLGPIGAAVGRQVLERRGFEAVAAVDTDPGKAGRDLGEICGLDGAVGLTVRDELETALVDSGADIAVLCTGSSLAGILPQLEVILGAGLPIVSTTEELSYPFFSEGSLARKVDDLALAAGVAVVGTGVNPGFAMDTLPIVLTAACERVDSIVVERVQDAGRRRLSFQQKIGAGLDPEVFRAQVDEGRLGHVGLTESIAMIAAALGWDLARITDAIEPKIAPQPVTGAAITVDTGQVAGIVQDGTGYLDGQPVIRLHMEAFMAAPQSYDSVRIEGSPSLYSRIEGGIPGDLTTASITVNTLPRALAAAPGLRTMRDLTIPSWWSGYPKNR